MSVTVTVTVTVTSTLDARPGADCASRCDLGAPTLMQVVEKDLRRLVQRRLFELDVTPEQASLRSRGAVPRETIRQLAHGLWPVHLSDGLARALARALDVTEYRVRRAAGLPVMEPSSERTRPHLRVVGRERGS
jgi:hypothetical protein